MVGTIAAPRMTSTARTTRTSRIVYPRRVARRICHPRSSRGGQPVGSVVTSPVRVGVRNHDLRLTAGRLANHIHPSLRGAVHFLFRLHLEAVRLPPRVEQSLLPLFEFRG